MQTVQFTSAMTDQKFEELTPAMAYQKCEEFAKSKGEEVFSFIARNVPPKQLGKLSKMLRREFAEQDYGVLFDKRTGVITIYGEKATTALKQRIIWLDANWRSEEESKGEVPLPKISEILPQVIQEEAKQQPPPPTQEQAQQQLQHLQQMQQMHHEQFLFEQFQQFLAQQKVDAPPSAEDAEEQLDDERIRNYLDFLWECELHAKEEEALRLNHEEKIRNLRRVQEAKILDHNQQDPELHWMF